MARFARLIIPKFAHHDTQCGNRRLPIFFSDISQELSIVSPEFHATGRIPTGCYTANMGGNRTFH